MDWFYSMNVTTLWCRFIHSLEQHCSHPVHPTSYSRCPPQPTCAIFFLECFVLSWWCQSSVLIKLMCVVSGCTWPQTPLPDAQVFCYYQSPSDSAWWEEGSLDHWRRGATPHLTTIIVGFLAEKQWVLSIALLIKSLLNVCKRLQDIACSVWHVLILCQNIMIIVDLSKA